MEAQRINAAFVPSINPRPSNTLAIWLYEKWLGRQSRRGKKMRSKFGFYKGFNLITLSAFFLH